MILVTGGTGLVGAHLLAELVNTKQQIRALYRRADKKNIAKKILSYYFKEETERYFSKIEWVQADINDIPALTDAFAGIEQVYHCAGYISYDPKEEQKLQKINLEGTANVVNLCLAFDVKKMCFVSSIASLEKDVSKKTITEENDFTAGNATAYAITKHAAEMEVWRASQEGLDVVIVNPGIIIGAGQWNLGSGLLFSKMYAGFSYRFPKTTGFVAVEDVTKAMVQLMESSVTNERFILVAENLSFENILSEIAKSLKRPMPKKKLKPWMVFLGWIVQWIGNKLFGTKRMVYKRSMRGLFEKTFYDSSKIKQALGFEFSPIKNAIEQTGKRFLKEMDKQ